ncbi:MAG: tRNA pseudouridine(55) synthase TruB [Clostridia bacterium]|nr:tRNA pseudouridine(55) synthase TruB [Clostridia bacterium]
MEKIEGIIVVYKEKGCTSHDVVGKVRKIVGTKKVGHTGTLDPEAEGVLPVCVGRATKIANYITEKEKEYIAEIKFGVVTDTQDMTGNIIAENNDFTLDKDEVTKVINSFVGEYMQTPPIYSAVKVKGKKLYEYARNGETVKIPARKVQIFSIDILDIDEKTAKIKVRCGKGTYIRALCHDIGKKLGIGAAMQSLIRTKSGIFEQDKSVKISELEKLVKEDKINEVLLQTDCVFKDLTRVNVKEEGLKRLINGNILTNDDIEDSKLKISSNLYAVYYNDVFYALYKGDKEDGKNILKIEKMFNIQED